MLSNRMFSSVARASYSRFAVSTGARHKATSSMTPAEPLTADHVPFAWNMPMAEHGKVGHLGEGLTNSVPISPNTPDRRQIDMVPSVRPEHEYGKNPLCVSPEEWQARVDSAATHRALYMYGMGWDLAAQCVMQRIPGTEEFLLGEWGVFFEEVTASNLLKYDFEGNHILPSGAREPATPGRSNMGCIPVAAAIFQARPDVHSVCHVHPDSVMAVGGMEAGLLPLSQAAFFLFGKISREGYDFTYENSFEDGLRKGFCDGQRAMLLNHHGMYAVGRDAAESFFVAKHLTQACDVQVKTLAMAGGDLSKVIIPDSSQLRDQFKDMMLSPDYSYDGSREWPGLIRKLQREHPDFNM